MMIAIIAILYFIAFFGFFEVYMFKRGITYWQRPLIVTVYFLVATTLALIYISDAPLVLAQKSFLGAIVLLMALYVFLLALALRGYFTYDGEAVDPERGARKESLRYVAAKTADILFQDTLTVIIVTSLFAATANALLTAVFFEVYFVLSHALLFVILPKKFALIFGFASLIAGFVFASIVILGINILYLFILHWIFYVAAYPAMRNVRKLVLPIPGRVAPA